MSQAGIVDIEGSHPQIPTMFVTNVGTAIPIANTIEILGATVAAHGVPIETTGSGNTITIEAQYASAAASSVGTNAGFASFNSADFSVDANGFVSFIGTPIETIDGDTGSISGSTVTIFADNAANNCGSSVFFTNSGTVSTFNVTDSNSNVFIGFESGNVPQSGTQNCCVGWRAGQSIASNSNTAFGFAALNSNSSGADNVAIGHSCQNAATGSQNVAVGSGAMGNNNVTGGDNVVIGHTAGFQMSGGANQNVIIGANAYDSSTPTGASNVIIGYGAGIGYEGSESSNILIGEGVGGTLSESNVTRIGQAGVQSACYVAGITGVTVTGSAPVGVNSSGQLSSLGFGSSGQVFTSNGASNSPTWQNGAFTPPTYTDEGTSFAVTANNGYFVTGAATATLPASPAQGNMANFILDAAVTLTIRANTGQKIRLGAAVSASAGSCVSSTQGNAVTLVYRSSDTTWIALNTIGTWSIT